MAHSLWLGKITQRLFAVFLLFALVPTAALTWFALGYISDKATRQVEEVQFEQAGMRADALLGRLVVLGEQLNQFARESAAGIEPGSDVVKTIGGSNFRVFPANVLDDASGLLSREGSRERLTKGQLLLARIAWDRERRRPYLLRSLAPGDPDAPLAAAVVSELVVLGGADSRDLRNIDCVHDETGATMFATDWRICDSFAGRGIYSGESRGNIVQSVGGEGYHAAFRSVFMGSLYGARDWRVLIARAADEVLASAESFRKRFLFMAVLLILSISLASIYLIRRQMAPLGSIMSGIERVTRREYETHVAVESGDEFEDLAEAFNAMSSKVSHQLQTQESMSEIDRLILSRIKTEDIIRVVLEKTHRVLPAESIAMINLEKGTETGELYWLSESAGGEMLHAHVAFDADSRNALKQQGHLLIRSDSGPLPEYILAAEMAQSSAFELLPVHVDNELAALIILGHSNSPVLDQEAIKLAQNYADRIAVALANAEWEDRLFRQAHYDSLTGLPNRLAFVDRLKQSIIRARRQGNVLGILFVDLDNFKLVNDSLGHQVGDRFIQIIAERFKACLRAEDSVARLGGDEFVITALGSEDHELTVASLSRMAERVLAAAMESVNIEGHDLRGSASVGIALYPKDGEDAEELVRNADTAMYHAKNLGRGTFQFYSAEFNEELMELMRLSTDIRGALEKNEFELYYQPKVNTVTHALTGAEALLRWHHPERGTVSPDVFIKAAEGLGLISAIGDWTLDATCKQIREWAEVGLVLPRISVNISAAQLRHGDLYGDIKDALRRYQLKGSLLEVEITENLLVHDMESAIEVLEKLRRLGVRVSLDDYGTGYSSLSYMKHLPVDTLKIDRCFIESVDSDAADRAIVNSTVVLARHLGMTVLAEGVETEAQLDALKAIGCDEIQGFYFSQPMPADDFYRMLREDASLTG